METIISSFSGNFNEGLLLRHLTTNYSMNGSFHRHESYEIYLFLRGNVNCYVEQQCFHLKRGDLLVIRPGQYHRPAMLDHSNYERITLNLSESIFRHFSSRNSDLSAIFQETDKDKACYVHLTNDQLEQYLSHIGEIETLLASGSFGADLLIQAQLTQLLVLLNQVFRTADGQSSNIMPKLIRDLLRYIDSNLSEKITLETLEQEFYLNGTYISRQFKKHTGLTLREYLLERRISHARTLLSSDLSITEVCQQSGFSDYANFIRSFTKTVGISPGKYAKQQKNQS
ncbi:MAG: helix-turn-helix transcriptional regulator [Lachnospiraceae bacterium]|nr:helix-turn-helix transcriptional regulator [Lachnospiraceae bacterium]